MVLELFRRSGPVVASEEAGCRKQDAGEESVMESDIRGRGMGEEVFVFEVTLRFDSAIGESRVSTESERGSGRGSEMDVQAWRRWWWRGRAREEDQFQYHKLRATLLVCCSPLASPHACAESGWCMQRARASVHAGSVYGNRHAVHEKNREEDVDEENKRKTRLQVFCVSKVCVSLRHSNI